MDIRSETLWLNKNIIWNMKEIHWKDWQEKGINIIHDIVDARGKFLSINELKQKYKLTCDALKYNKLKDIIPREWRKTLKTTEIQHDAVSFTHQIRVKIDKKYKQISQITNKEVYWTFIRNIQKKPIITEKLQQIYNIQENDWPIIFTMSKVLRDTKIRTFQFKILYNLIPCNLYLNRIKRSDTNKCAICKELDDIVHYFFACRPQMMFWRNFSTWWRNAMDEEIKLSEKEILLGYFEHTSYYLTLNACILLAKWHIFKTKLNEDNIFFYKFLCDLKYYLLIEKSIAVRQGKLKQHDKNWRQIEDYIT